MKTMFHCNNHFDFPLTLTPNINSHFTDTATVTLTDSVPLHCKPM